MDFNFDTGAIFDGIQIIDPTVLPPLGGQAGVLTILGTGAVTLSNGDTAERPAFPAAAMLRFNNDTTLLEYYDGTSWNPLSTSSSTVSSVAANSNSASLTITGSPITSAGTFQFTLDAGLEALGQFSTTGILVATGTNTWNSRTITGIAGNIDVTDGSGVAGNPTIDLAAVTQGAAGSFLKFTLDGFGRVTANTPVVTSDITTLVDGTYVNISGDTMASGANLTFVGGGEVLGLPNTPSAPDAATSKYYVDSVAAGLSWKQAVIVATTANVDLAAGGLLNIDGVTVADGDRVLVKNQTSLPENGLYNAHAGAWTRTTDMDSTTPINEVNGAAVYVEQGTTQANTGWTQIDTVVTIGTDPIQWSQFSGTGAYTGGTGITVSGNIISLQTPVAIANGGTNTSSTPSNGQLLIGNGADYTLATLGASTGISITNGAGSITVNNTGVTSLSGTTNEVTVSAATGAVTVGLPTDVVIANSLTVSTLTPNAAVYVGTAGLLTSTAALTDGQILVGSTGNSPVATTITAGSGVNVTNASGSITLSADTSVLVSTFSAGTTGFTPNSATSGAVTLDGTLNTGHGGTGLTTIGTADQFLSVNNGATGLEYKTISAGTGISVTPGAGVLTIVNTGVTSVALSDGSTTPIYTISGSPVTTTGTLTFTLASQSANTVFAAPNGSAGQPGFRALVLDDLSTALQLYTENPSTPTAPSATGANAVAIGSGAAATADGSFAEGDGTDARIFGQKAYANGSFATAGDAQHGLYVARTITTDNTSNVELFLDGSSTQLVLPVNSLFTFDILVAGRRTDATGGGAGYRFVGVAKRDSTAGSITFVGTPSKTVIGETDNPWDSSVSVDTSTGALRVHVTGQNAKTIRWVATIQTTEVTN